MFRKLVAIEPLNITDASRAELRQWTHQIRFYDDRPQCADEVLRRIGDADGVLVSYTTPITADVLRACPSLRYIGMCCSLYGADSSNVDLHAAEESGIVVRGVRDYGDAGVAEFVVSELVRLLHGFGDQMWRSQPMELTGMRVGIVGMGTTGTLLARTLGGFHADVMYFSRTRKQEIEEAEGFGFLRLDDLLARSDIVCTCLNKNVVLLNAHEFDVFGAGKILVNTSISPSYDVEAAQHWLDGVGNFLIGDTWEAIGLSEGLRGHRHVICGGKSAGLTALSFERLGRKVIDNIQDFFAASHDAGRHC